MAISKISIRNDKNGKQSIIRKKACFNYICTRRVRSKSRNTKKENEANFESCGVNSLFYSFFIIIFIAILSDKFAQHWIYIVINLFYTELRWNCSRNYLFVHEFILRWICTTIIYTSSYYIDKYIGFFIVTYLLKSNEWE